jgi:hypothetical protein
MTVPISLAKGLGWVDFSGGRGLLFVTDVDTVLLDMSILASVGLLILRRRSLNENAPYVWYVIALALITGALLSLVVTNFGTLFRLRLLMAVPIWMLPLATVHHGAFAGASAERSANHGERVRGDGDGVQFGPSADVQKVTI